jgi:peroxiredoxin
MRLEAGDPAKGFEVRDIHDRPVTLTDYEGKTLLLSFYRYAACPFCNLRVRRLCRAHPLLRERGLEMLAFFESPRESIEEYVGKAQAPFPIVPDPERVVYRAYGVESSWPKFFRGAKRVVDLVVAASAGLLKHHPEGDVHLVPADFLIGPDLVILAAHYGQDIGDHLPLDRIEALTGASFASIEGRALSPR